MDYCLNLNNKILELQKDISDLKYFKSQFAKKNYKQKLDYDYNLSIKEMSNHFNKSYENMRQLKKKYEENKDKNNMWLTYCKAYYFDKEINKK